MKLSKDIDSLLYIFINSKVFLKAEHRIVISIEVTQNSSLILCQNIKVCPSKERLLQQRGAFLQHELFFN